MDYDNNLDLTNVCIQDFDKMVDPMVILKGDIQYKTRFYFKFTSSKHCGKNNTTRPYINWFTTIWCFCPNLKSIDTLIIRHKHG